MRAGAEVRNHAEVLQAHFTHRAIRQLRLRDTLSGGESHIECEWPNSRPLIDKIYADIPEPDKRKIWAGNAVEFFNLAN